MTKLSEFFIKNNFCYISNAIFVIFLLQGWSMKGETDEEAKPYINAALDTSKKATNVP